MGGEINTDLLKHLTEDAIQRQQLILALCEELDYFKAENARLRSHDIAFQWEVRRLNKQLQVAQQTARLARAYIYYIESLQEAA